MKEGIWLDHLFAEARGLKPGDNITIEAFGYKQEITILGLVMNPEYVYAPGEDDIVPNHANFGFGYIPADIMLASLMQHFCRFNRITCERRS